MLLLVDIEDILAMQSSSLVPSFVHTRLHHGLYNCYNRQCRNTTQSNDLCLKVNVEHVSSVEKKVSCKECFTTWFVCTECKKRFSTRKYSLGVRHFQTIHANVTMYKKDDNADYVIEDDMRNSGNSSQMKIHIV